jgi:serine/threonine-protein kinase HipA
MLLQCVPFVTNYGKPMIGSKYKFSEVQLRHWEQFAAAAGLAKAQAKKRIGVLATSLPPVARQLQGHPPARLCRSRHR